jgi:hypothetical protein
MEAEAELQANIDNKADNTHNHDDLYYTETEMNDRLSNFQESVDGSIELEKTRAINAESALQAAIDAINTAGIGPHNHDDIYYTETEINTKFEDINEVITNNNTMLNNDITTAKNEAISASNSYTDIAISALVDSAPEAMNTLKELANAINEHKDDYDAYVGTISANILAAKNEAINEATTRDTDLHNIISAEIDADVKDEKERAMEAEAELQASINNKADIGHNHDDRYYTETEMNSKLSTLQTEIEAVVEDEKERAIEVENDLRTSLSSKADSNHGVHIPSPQTADNTVFLRNDNTWQKITPANIGAANLTDIDNLEVSIQSQINSLTAKVIPTVTAVSVSSGTLTLTDNKYQKCTNMVSGTNIVFPSVTNFTEIHLYFSASTDMNLIFPECKWRVDPSIESGKSYEIVAIYNTMEWLVNIIVYS